jgi:hypothetical protein
VGFTKRIRITALLLTALILAGCSAQPNTSFSGSKQDSITIPQTSDVSKESKAEDFSSQEDTTDGTEETAEHTASESMDKPETEKEVENTASEPITSSHSVTDKPKTTIAETEKTKSPATSTETSVVQSEPPVQTKKQLATEPVPETVTETEAAPETEPEQAAPFDIDYWISYAKTTAQQNGLSLDSTATDCWDNPITANPNCIYLERDINSRMSRYARDGFTCVWVWYECIGTDSYLIYVGYA